MPTTITANVRRVTASATVADLPDDSTASRYTWAFTGVPIRGVVTRIMFRITDGSAINGSGDTEYTSFYLHTTCAAGAGKNKTVASEAQTVIAQYNWSLEKSLQLGGNRLFATGTYCIAASLNQVQLSGGSAGSTWDAQDSNSQVYYDLSGTTKGPAVGTGTLYLTMSGQGNQGYDYTSLDTAKVTILVEPAV